MVLRYRAVWALLGGLLLVQGAAQAGPPGQVYRCRAYGGGQFWSDLHCQQHGALIERIESVPAGMSFERQLKVVEQGTGRGAKVVGVGTERRGEPAVIEREARARAREQVRLQARCARWQAEFERQQAFSRQSLTARRQEFIRHKQQALRLQREQAGCR
ncbi:MAG: hypothetical protein RLZZ22_179 [Pseudomonadota bacterium]